MSSTKHRKRQELDAINLTQSYRQTLVERLFQPVDGASLAVFRICFALAMAWHLAKQFSTLGGGTVIDFLYGNAAFSFPYRGFEWVQPLPSPWLNLVFAGVLLAALLVVLGLYYRIAAIAMFLGYTYIFLLEQSRYNNHYYLMCLICFLLVFVPANTRFSVDAWRSRTCGSSGGGAVPFWSIALLRFQLFVMYFFGGIAKLNWDWLSGSPLLGPAELVRNNLCLPLGDWISVTGIALFLAWGGLFYDLLIGFLLLWSRTRVLAILLTFGFHLHNHLVFPIGVFPTLAFTATLIFLRPDWPIRLYHRIPIKRLHGSLGAVGGIEDRHAAKSVIAGHQSSRRFVIGLLACWTVFQVVVPLRHHWIAGDANWTEEGQDFSWRMMLRQKAAGSVTFVLADSGLQYTDDRGNSRIHWDRWPADLPHAIHVPIESHQFNWAHHPGLTVTFEPCLGQRVLQRLGPVGETQLEELKHSIQQKWISLYGHAPESVRETIGLPKALRNIRDEISNLKTDPDAQALESDVVLQNEVTSFLDRSIVDLDSDGPAELNEAFFVELTDFLTRLETSRFRAIVRRQLCCLHPFSLQGANASDERFLVVKDPVIEDAVALNKLAGDEPYLVWVDLGRLTPAAWNQLPRAIVSFESRQLKILWNHFRELNRVQLDRFTIRPSMIHHYAGHVAESWESTTGRRPEVRVHSNVMLNYKYPKSLIDPSVDLASVPYLRLRHNDWITQLNSKPIRRMAQR